ncbi:TetR/AcrR family transcriptional regulator [Fodinibius salsisoli]|uniref:TetR/AcrR family transcriptional regulator n=1 Tax=Fodinibius salsisoli TaxID=2820877 RepID=A0ABT3PI89_9BACT|nr:TetR/AcrR family transcriptional regulator [Fodinibius salsisoli]MCW9705632.1 TetR/AcrR family transcriptional regulator [Fodinibius salsisoli]
MAEDTRTEIIEAARREFLAHGYEGARLQKIADQIGVTKAMIHYYFNTKKELFEQVYSRSVELMFSGLSETLEKDIPLFKKIDQLVTVCMEKAQSESEVLGFVLTESDRNTEWLLPIFDEHVTLEKGSFTKQLEEAASNYMVSSVQPEQLLLNIFSLCYYPSLSSAINRSLLGVEVDGDISKRKGIVLDTVLNWLTA